MFKTGNGRSGIKYQTTLTTKITNQLQRPIYMVGRFRMKSNPRGTRLGKIADQIVHRTHHQMHINGSLDATLEQVIVESLTHQRADGQIRNIVIIHYIKMNNIGTGSNYSGHIFTQPSEISRQYGRSD